MYSVVLMMAMTTGGEVPDLGGRRCGGCNGCFGCSGCYGCHGCHGCRGCGGLFGRKHRRHGCCGCNGGWTCGGCTGWVCGGCTGWTCGGCTGVVTSCCGVEVIEKKTEEADESGDGEETESRISRRPATAKVVVKLPADAKLTINGVSTKSTSSKRTFVTPTLQAGRDYFYTLKAEVVREGKKTEVSERVTVRAGKTSTITLNLPAVEVAQR